MLYYLFRPSYCGYVTPEGHDEVPFNSAMTRNELTGLYGNIIMLFILERTFDIGFLD